MNIQRIELEVNEAKDNGGIFPLVDGATALRADAKLVTGAWATAVLEIVHQIDPKADWRSLVPVVTLTPSSPYTPVPVYVAGSYRVGVRINTVEGGAGRVAVWLSLFKE